MSATVERAKRRDIRRALGSNAEQMLRDVAEGIEQLGDGLNDLRKQVLRPCDTCTSGWSEYRIASDVWQCDYCYRVEPKQDAIIARFNKRINDEQYIRKQLDQLVYDFTHRSFAGRLRWLLTGR